MKEKVSNLRKIWHFFLKIAKNAKKKKKNGTFLVIKSSRGREIFNLFP